MIYETYNFINGSFVGVDEFFECSQMLLEGNAPRSGNGVLCVGLASDEGLLHQNVLLLFQGLQVAGEIAVGHVEKLL